MWSCWSTRSWCCNPHSPWQCQGGTSNSYGLNCSPAVIAIDHLFSQDCLHDLKQLYTNSKSAFSSLPSELLFGHAGYVYALLYVNSHIPGAIEEGLLAEVKLTSPDVNNTCISLYLHTCAGSDTVAGCRREGEAEECAPDVHVA